MAAAISRDTRVPAVSLADRLHNMRTLRFLPQATQLRKAREVLDFFVPVAQQLLAQQLRMDPLSWSSPATSTGPLFATAMTASTRAPSAASSACRSPATGTRAGSTLPSRPSTRRWRTWPATAAPPDQAVP